MGQVIQRIKPRLVKLLVDVETKNLNSDTTVLKADLPRVKGILSGFFCLLVPACPIFSGALQTSRFLS